MGTRFRKLSGWPLGHSRGTRNRLDSIGVYTREAMAAFSDTHALRCIRLGAERAAANLHIELGRGVMSLRAAARVAPLLGIFGTAVPLRSALHSVPGCGYGDFAGGVADTFVPFALSLLVSVLASGGIHYLRRQVDAFDLEMHVGTLNLLDHLVRRSPGS